jgi:hypothetical protein
MRICAGLTPPPAEHTRGEASDDAAERSEDALAAALASPALWTALYHGPRAPWADASDADAEAFGHAQPGVRRAAWKLLGLLLHAHKAGMPALLPALAPAALRSAFVEPDALVRGDMLTPLVTLLRGERRRLQRTRHADCTPGRLPRQLGGRGGSRAARRARPDVCVGRGGGVCEPGRRRRGRGRL